MGISESADVMLSDELLSGWGRQDGHKRLQSRNHMTARCNCFDEIRSFRYSEPNGKSSVSSTIFFVFASV